MQTELPDTSRWQPRAKASETLASALLHLCENSEARLGEVMRHETEMAIDAFDSGEQFEAAVREEIGALLPGRYKVTSGSVLDSLGRSAGQADLVVFNDLWFPHLKAASTGGGGAYLPIEGAYAIGEVKQTLSIATFDAAMEKLVKCQRLHRPRTYANRIVENREGADCPHGLTNPLFTFILGGRLEKGLRLEDLINRLFDISKGLKRLEVVRALCVPGEGFVTWAFRDPLRDLEVRPALFMRDDLFLEVVPAYVPATQSSALYGLAQYLGMHLYHSVLAPEDLVVAYGPNCKNVKLPAQPDIFLPPDADWKVLLSTPCSRHP